MTIVRLASLAPQLAEAADFLVVHVMGVDGVLWLDWAAEDEG